MPVATFTSAREPVSTLNMVPSLSLAKRPPPIPLKDIPVNSGRLPSVVASAEQAAADSSASSASSSGEENTGASTSSSSGRKKQKGEVQHHAHNSTTFGEVVDRISANDPEVTFVRVCGINGAERFVDLARAVADNTHLKTLVLGSTEMEARGMMALAKALTRNKTLTAFRCVYDQSILDGRWDDLTEAIAKSPNLQEAVLSHSFTLSDNVAAIMGDLLSENRSLRRLWLGQLSQAGCEHMTQCFSSILPGNIRATDFELYDIQGNKVRYSEWEAIMARNKEFARWLDDYDFENLYDVNRATSAAVQEVMCDQYGLESSDKVLGFIVKYLYDTT